jgi:MFS family permease
MLILRPVSPQFDTAPEQSPVKFRNPAVTSTILGPVIAGFIVGAAGYDGAFYVAAAVAAAGGLWWLVGVPAIRQVELD